MTQVETVAEGEAVAHLAGVAQVLPLRETHETALLIPVDDVADPVLSIVIPAKNEEVTICDFVAWCLEGLAEAGVAGEILIVDDSTDGTAELAVSAGARVLRTTNPGLGRAYIDALPAHPGAVGANGGRGLHL